MSLLAQTSTQQLVTSSITAVNAQFRTLSTLTFNVSSINGIVPGAAFSGSTVALSTGLITTNTLTTNSINLNGGTVSNVASNFFITPKFTTTFTPTSISGLKAWFDASQTTSILSNGSGQVGTWSNLAPGYANAVQATTSNQPFTGRLSANNLNLLQFNNFNGLTYGTINWTSPNQSVFAVVLTPTVATNWLFGGGDARDATRSFVVFEFYLSGLEGTTTNGGALINTISSNDLISQNTYNGNPWVLSIHKGSATNGLYINGTSNTGVSNFGTGSFTDLFGSATLGNTTFTEGNTFYIGEFIHYDSDLTLLQKQTVEGYLAWKWGRQASLNGIHPYYLLPPPPVGTVYLPAGSVGTDATSNLTIQATANTKISLAGNTQITGFLTTSSIGISSINNSTLTHLITQPLQSTFTGITQSLGTAGYISSSQLYSTVQGIGSGFTGSTIGLSAATINTSTLNTRYLSSVQGYVSSLRTDSLTVGGPTGYVTVQDLTTGTVSTGQLVAGAGFISSLQINTLSFGPSGYVIVGDVIANSLSTKKLNTQALYTNNAYIGNVSSQSAILFPGIDGTYRGTAVAEQTTGIGTQELLLYKVSSTTDQIRLQTTGNIVFEAGAASRSWNSTTQLATPTLYIAGSTSNVGVGTAAPAATLDVAGTGRFQTLSSFALNVSSINGIVPGAAFNGSTVALSTGSITTNSLQAYSYVNMTGGVFSNVATEYFTTPKFTTTFSPTSISGLKQWFDASQTTSILSNGSGQVYQWNNLAPGYANATQPTSSNQPITGAATVNGLNVLTYNTNSFILTGSTTFSSQYRSLFMVVKVSSTASNGAGSVNYAFWGGSAITVYQIAYPDFEVNNIPGNNRIATIFNNNALSNIYNVPYVFNIYSSASGNGFFIDGSNTGACTTFPTGSFTDAIGSNLQGASNWFLCEAIHYDADLSASQRQTVEGYLAWKWGFQNTLITTQSYYSVPPPPTGTVYLPSGNIGTDATSNLAIQATLNTKISLVGNTQITGILTLSSIGVSTINGAVPWQQSFLNSTVQGITSNISSMIDPAELTSTITGLGTIGAGGGGGGTTFVGSTTFLSATQVLFSTQTGYNISSVLGYVSSLQVDELQIGTGFGIIAFGDTNMSSISTLGIAAGLGNFQTINVSSINGALPGTGTGSGSGNFGTVSSLTAIRFFGLTGGFTNTAIAEVSTGIGTQELLLYKVSSISDQIRMQTTGNVIFESGVSARGWPTAPRIATPNLYIAASNSNVGIGTSNPLVTLDVAGTGRFQTLSSLNITAGSINYSVAFV